jgi:hypothetical protein
MSACAAEVEMLTVVVRRLAALGVAKVLPSLETLAVASIYGVNHLYWQFYERYTRQTHTPAESRPLGCKLLFEQLISSGSLRHVCIRNPSGPLSLPGTATPLLPRPRPHLPPITTVHLEADFELAPMGIVGTSIRLVSDIPAEDDWLLHLHQMGYAVERALAQQNPGPGVALDVEIYLSNSLFSGTRFEAHPEIFALAPATGLVERADPPRTLSVPLQRLMATKIGGVLQKFLRNTSGREDTVRWHASADSPICGACGSGAPA